MKIDLDHLLVIDAIDRRGSFARAADELHRVPSAVTYAVNKLEQDLGVQIFDRSGHRARLTDTGEKVLREGRDLLRFAMRLEAHAKYLSEGWEPELRIAFGDLVLANRLHKLIGEFFAEHGDRTRLRLSREVYGGCWDALAGDRADLVIGAPYGIPAGGGYASQPLGEIRFKFVVAPQHPLASEAEPLAPETIQRHRAVSLADTSRSLSPRTSGLLSGQEVLSVADMLEKRHLQLLGLGVGYLPDYLVAADITAGRLVEKEVEEARETGPLFVAWRSDFSGKALDWFGHRLADPDVQRDLFADFSPGEVY
jgi:DNA-binding transcriptional LysR family regulator